MMRAGVSLVLIGLWGLVGCDDEQAAGQSAADAGGRACVESSLAAQCPQGTSAVLGAQAVSACEGSVSGLVEDAVGQAAGQCYGAGSCRVVCRFAVPCRCGVAAITVDGVECASCDGAASCGNDVCEGGETPENCPVDCGAVCEPGETRCDGATLESCDLRGRWERLACPEGEICSAEEGPPACVRDLDIIGGGDAGVTDGGPRPADGRLVEGEGTWPPAESAAQDLPVLDNLDERFSLRLPLLTDGVNREDTPIARAMRRIGTGGRVRFWRYRGLQGVLEGIGSTGRIHLDQAGSPIPRQVPVLGDYPPVTGEEACAALDACGAGFEGCLAAAADTSPTYLACATFQLGEDCARLPDLPMLCPNVNDAELRRDAEAGVLRYPEGVEVDPSLPIRERLFDGLTTVDLAAEVVHRTTAPAPYNVVQAHPRGDGEGGVAVATAGQDHVVLRWGLGDERAMAALPRAGEAPDLRAVRPDGQVVVLALNRSGDPALDGGLSVWNLAEGQWISSIRPPVGAQTIGAHVALFSLDNRHLVFDVDGRLLEVWDLQAEERTAILDYGDEAPPALVALAPNGRTLAIARQVEVTVQIDLFDLQAGGRLAGFSDRGRLLVQDLWSMAFTEDGSSLTIAGFTRDQELWLAVLGL